MHIDSDFMRWNDYIMIKCVHCDVDAYYRLTIEDFNKADSYKVDLCIKCILNYDFNISIS
jgi:hypothetical protein